MGKRLRKIYVILLLVAVVVLAGCYNVGGCTEDASKKCYGRFNLVKDIPANAGACDNAYHVKVGGVCLLKEVEGKTCNEVVKLPNLGYAPTPGFFAQGFVGFPVGNDKICVPGCSDSADCQRETCWQLPYQRGGNGLCVPRCRSDADCISGVTICRGEVVWEGKDVKLAKVCIPYHGNFPHNAASFKLILNYFFNSVRYSDSGGVIAHGAGAVGVSGQVVGGGLDNGYLSLAGNENSYLIADTWKDIPPHVFPSSAFTITFWMKSGQAWDEPGNNDGAGLVSYAVGDGRAANEVLIMYYAQDSVLKVFVDHDGGGNFQTAGISVPTLFNNAWHHVAVTWRGSDGKVNVYIDGIRVGGGTLRSGARVAPNGKLVLGQDQDVLGGGFQKEQSYQGLMDDFQIYDYVKSSYAIQSLVDFGVDKRGGDGDGLLGRLDNCPLVENFWQEDQDLDGIGDACDNCPAASNSNQADANSNSVGDACEQAEAPPPADTDSDGVSDDADWCANTPAGSVVGDNGCLVGDVNGDTCVNLLDIWSLGADFPPAAIQNINLWC